MDPLEPDDNLGSLSERNLAHLLAGYERRRPGAPVASIGVRPHRQPWTYRDIRELERLRAEVRRRGLPPNALSRLARRARLLGRAKTSDETQDFLVVRGAGIEPAYGARSTMRHATSAPVSDWNAAQIR